MARPDDFFDRLNVMNPPSPFLADKPRDLARAQQTVREALQRVLNTAGIPLKSEGAEVRILEAVREAGNLRRSRVALTICEGLSCPIHLLMPPGAPRFGAVLYLYEASGADAQPPADAMALARCGFVVAIPDLAGFGALRLRQSAHAAAPSGACYAMTSALLMHGLHMPGLRVYQCLRVMDYLQHHPEVDPQRMGVMGLGAGAQTAVFLAALDGRIKATALDALPAPVERGGIPGGVDQIVPGLYTAGDMTDAASLIAPRPLYVCGSADGASDRSMPDRLHHVYTQFSVPDRLVDAAKNGEGQELDGITKFFDKWLIGRASEG